MFPRTTAREVEQFITRYFNNARDRFGGRKERAAKKQPVPIESPRHQSSVSATDSDEPIMTNQKRRVRNVIVDDD